MTGGNAEQEVQRGGDSSAVETAGPIGKKKEAEKEKEAESAAKELAAKELAAKEADKGKEIQRPASRRRISERQRAAKEAKEAKEASVTSEEEVWPCGGCTFLNPVLRAQCEMCGTQRPVPELCRNLEQGTRRSPRVAGATTSGDNYKATRERR